MQVSLYNDIFILDDGEVREFLFLSRTTALLIDTGFPGTHIIDVVRRITSLPITVLLTHGDGDHRGGLCDFEECYVHERDKNLIPSDVQTYNIRQGEYIRAGKYSDCKTVLLNTECEDHGQDISAGSLKEFVDQYL